MRRITKYERAELVDLYIHWQDNRNNMPLEMERKIAETILNHFGSVEQRKRLRKEADQRRKFKKKIADREGSSRNRTKP